MFIYTSRSRGHFLSSQKARGCYIIHSPRQHPNTTSLLQVDQDHQDVDDVRHYDVQGDEMSAASLSSLASGELRWKVEIVQTIKYNDGALMWRVWFVSTWMFWDPFRGKAFIGMI